jgi:DNA-binding HxlR family transcriptional regulator
MEKTVPGIKWNASSEAKINAIIHILSENHPRPVRWRDLWDRLRSGGDIRSKATLNLYLKSLEAKGIVEADRRSRREVYYKLTRRGVDKIPMLKILLEWRGKMIAPSTFGEALKQLKLPEEKLRDYIFIILSYAQLGLLTVLLWPSVFTIGRSFIKNRLVPEYVNCIVDIIGQLWTTYPELASEAYAYLTYTFLNKHMDFYKGKRIVPLDFLYREGIFSKINILPKSQKRMFGKYTRYLKAGLTFNYWMKLLSEEKVVVP